MSVTETIVRTRLLHPDRITETEALDLAAGDALARRDIFCPVTGGLLDSRKVIIVTITASDGSEAVNAFHPSAAETITARLSAPEAAAALTEAGATVRITDAADVLRRARGQA
jgi:hypothetical protein